MQQPYWVHHKGGSVPSAFSSHSASCSSVHSADIRASWWHGACNTDALAGTLLSKNALSRCCTWTVCWVRLLARDLSRNRKKKKRERTRKGKGSILILGMYFDFPFMSYAWLPTYQSLFYWKQQAISSIVTSFTHKWIQAYRLLILLVFSVSYKLVRLFAAFP